MAERVINDPSALGWEYDPETGRWTWGGHSSSGGGGGDVELSNYIDKTKRNDVVEGSFQIHWDDSADQTYPFNGRIGYNSSAVDPNSLEGSFLYASGTRGTFSIGRDGDVELHGPSEIQGIPDRNNDRPWITGFSYIQAADFLDADGNSIIGSGGGTVTTADVQLTNPTTFMPGGMATQEDANAYIGEELEKIIPDANADGTIYGRQNNAWVAVPTGGGGDGGADLSAYYTKAESDARYQPKGNYLVSSDLNGYATQAWVGSQGYLTSANLNGYATQTWVGQNYQPKGNYLTSESDPTVPSYVKSITQADINKWNNPPTGGGFNGSYSGQKVTFTTTDTTVSLDLIAPNCAIKMSGSGTTGKYMRLSGDKWEILTGNYAKILMQVNDNGNVTATDFIATSDRNKKDDIETAPTGVIEKLRGVTFKWKDSGAESSGVIAQELQDAGLGHLVHEDDDGLSVSYGGLTAYLIEELKLLRKELEDLKRDS